MTFPAPAPGLTTKIQEEDRRKFRPERGKWILRNNVGMIDKYYGGRSGETVNIDDMGMRPNGHIRMLWSLQPSSPCHIRMNFSSFISSWLSPTGSDFFNSSGFLRSGSASWRKSDWSSGNGNNNAGFVLNWGQGNDWRVKARTSCIVRADLMDTRGNESVLRWNLLYRNSASGAIATTNGMVSVKISANNVQKIAFNADASIIAGAVHVEGF